MTFEEFDFLRSEAGGRAVRENLAADPVTVALSCRSSSDTASFAAAIATQVKYLQRAKSKLPSWSSAGCIIPPLAFEQASAEAVASARSYLGELCIDLTCGLGVDAWCLSRRFRRVVAVERDALLAAVARYNFALLGATNIEVVEGSAEEFLAAPTTTGSADLIFADPDRRGAAGRKLYKLEDCSPNVVALMPRLHAAGKVVAIKCSPLFDVDMARIVAGEHTLCEVVSLGGECKEVLIETGTHIAAPRIRATAIGLGSAEYAAVRPRRKAPPALLNPLYLIIPDVALQKARLAIDYFSDLGAYIASDNGYALHNVILDTKLGRTLCIVSIDRFSPKKLAAKLKERGIKRLDILVRDFPFQAAEIARRLSVREGGAIAMVLTRLDGEPVAIEVEKLKEAERL